MAENMNKTGTTTLGMVCKEGLVIAADKRVTAGNLIASKKFDKIQVIADTIAITTSGLVSDAQLLTKVVRGEIKLKEVQTGRKITVKEAVNILANLNYSNIRTTAGIVGFLAGGYDQTSGYSLWDIGADGSIIQTDEYVTDGSGSVFVHGVLETLYKKDMPMQECVELAVKALDAAQKRDNASGSGFDVVVINKDGLKRVITKEYETRFSI